MIVASLGGAALGPAAAEDSGFWETVRAAAGSGIRAVASPPGFAVVPVAPRAELPRPQVIRLPSPTLAKPTPPDPSKRDNPFATLLRDPTLRYGDVVMFPGGPRVFRGEPGGRHSVHDFAAVSASKDLPSASRKTVLAMPVGENTAWSANVSANTGKVARSTVDVETTGSLGDSRGKTVTVRTGRGDVRVIRVAD